MTGNSEALELKALYNSKFNSYTRTLIQRSNYKYPDKLKELAELRKISLEVLQEADIFYIGESSELLIPEFGNYFIDFGILSPSNKKPIFHNRWVFPIKDIQKNVINFVGYTPEEDERYVYGTAKYYDRAGDLYGLENYHLAVQEGYAIVTEGITDSFAYRSLGYKNSFAWCGTRASENKQMLLDRLTYGVIKIPDRDFAGLATRQKWQFRQSILLVTPYTFKDSAQVLEKDEWRKYFESTLPEVVNRLKVAHKRGIRLKDEPIYI